MQWILIQAVTSNAAIKVLNDKSSRWVGVCHINTQVNLITAAISNSSTTKTHYEHLGEKAEAERAGRLE